MHLLLDYDKYHAFYRAVKASSRDLSITQSTFVFSRDFHFRYSFDAWNFLRAKQLAQICKVIF
ncbi:hypothetical protein SAMN05421644_10495 [Allochromatium warmingii]|uniref:Uncharacterized protein n=1 Tax=Allochromatium warmingii TaxID=61595 RepID=A0A1H3C1K9_ALLWA|nr:hypothetical protein SAMN05421644_10495 [Allochromatium warmingii]